MLTPAFCVMPDYASTNRFAEYAPTARERIDAALPRFASLGEGCPDRLREAVLYSLMAPGKRLRPMLVLMAYEACGGQDDAAMPAACAVEMVHNYSLVHDDLPAMDNDDLRRGLPTCHRQFDEATAILVGDALLTNAFETLGAYIRPEELAGRCCTALARAAGPRNMVGGQVDDIAAPALPPSAELLESIHRRKTGAMIVVSLELGAMIAQADETKTRALLEFGRSIGLLFQITDDLLDVGSDTETMGKTVGRDAALGKLTFPALFGVEQSRARAEELTRHAQDALKPLGGAGDLLRDLALYVLERNR